MDMRNRWETSDTNPQRGPWEPPASPIEPPRLSMVLSELLDAAADAFDVDQEQSRALLRQARALLHSCAARHGLAERAPAQPALAAWQAKRIARHIDENLDQALPLGELAGVVGLSTSHFSRAFKGTFGQPPHAFIIGRRVSRACGEMLEGHEPLSQIALSCGFADQAHLARIFRRQMGSAPSAWRRDNILQGAIPHRNERL
jgi:AraC family transcriptional regulator